MWKELPVDPENEPPLLTEEVVAWVERMFPDRSPGLNTPDRKVWWDAGAADVAKFLRQTFNDQNNIDQEED